MPRPDEQVQREERKDDYADKVPHRVVRDGVELPQFSTSILFKEKLHDDDAN